MWRRRTSGTSSEEEGALTSGPPAPTARPAPLPTSAPPVPSVAPPSDAGVEAAAKTIAPGVYVNVEDPHAFVDIENGQALAVYCAADAPSIDCDGEAQLLASSSGLGTGFLVPESSACGMWLINGTSASTLVVKLDDDDTHVYPDECTRALGTYQRAK